MKNVKVLYKQIQNVKKKKKCNNPLRQDAMQIFLMQYN